MKKFYLPLIASFFLANCAGTLPPINVNTPASTIIADAQSLAARFCSVAPTAASIVNIFVANPLLMTAEDLGRAFCTAIMGTPQTAVQSDSLRANSRPQMMPVGKVVRGTYRGKPISGVVQ